MDQEKLDRREESLEARRKATEAFQNSRVAWSVPLRAIANTAPESTVIRACRATPKSRPGPERDLTAKKQLDLSFATPWPMTGHCPGDRRIPDVVREEPSLTRQFPIIEVSGLRANPMRQDICRRRRTASFACPGPRRAHPTPGRPGPAVGSEITRPVRPQDPSTSTHEPAALDVRPGHHIRSSSAIP